MNNSHKPSDWKDLAQSIRNAAPYINISYVLMASIAIMGLIGWWADSYFATKPLFIIIGLFAGLAAGMYNFYKIIKEQEKKDI